MKKLKDLVLRNAQRSAAAGAALVASLGASNAMAAIDMTQITSDLSAGETAVLGIGASIVLIFLGIFLYKVIRRAF